MWDRIKGAGIAIWVAVLAALAFYAATRAASEKRSRDKWMGQAKEHSEAHLIESIHEAEHALDRAHVHRKRAQAAATKTEKRLDAIARKDNEMADIVSRWNAGRLRDEHESQSVG